MPPSIFRGRPWPAPGEPLWLDADRDEALALHLEEQARCPGGCGELLAISTSPQADGEYAADEIRCHACAARARAASSPDDPQGLLTVIVRRPDIDPLEDLHG